MRANLRYTGLTQTSREDDVCWSEGATHPPLGVNSALRMKEWPLPPGRAHGPATRHRRWRDSARGPCSVRPLMMSARHQLGAAAVRAGRRPRPDRRVGSANHCGASSHLRRSRRRSKQGQPEHQANKTAKHTTINYKTGGGRGRFSLVLGKMLQREPTRYAVGRVTIFNNHKMNEKRERCQTTIN